ncbi:MAG: hypothetical protein JXA22_06415 [Candidatus Thermoplasmatota archaeon]|nr:hypothetical protein [Candidatus Thermoplasmatota archaeon]
MEAEGMDGSISTGALMGVNGDIAHALDRKKHMLALIPMSCELTRTFIGKVCSEAISRRKKLILLAPIGNVQIMADMVRELTDIAGLVGSIVSFTSHELRCGMDGSDNDPGDLLNHCVRRDRMDQCPYQTGFDLDIYREVKMSGGTLLGEMAGDVMKKGMCPARLALDLTTEAKIIVTDYGFVFSEGWDRLFEFMGQDPRETILAISDPPSLTEHLWDRFRYSFTDTDLLPDQWDLEGLKPESRMAVEVLLASMRELLQGWDVTKPLDRKNLIQLYRTRAQERGVTEGMGALTDDLKKLLDLGRFRRITDRKKVKDLYLFIKLWVKEHSSVARTVEEDRDQRTISLSLLDLQVMVRPILGSFPTVILFGDTLYPQELYTRLLGLRTDLTINRSYMTHEHVERTSVVSFGNVETSYKNRDSFTWKTIVDNIMRIMSTTPGMVMAVFPSYFIQENVMQELVERQFDRPIIEETRGMSREDRKRVLEELSIGGDVLVVCVQKGSLSRSLVEGGIRPDTVVMVGMHIPPPTPRSNQLKVHMQKTHGTNLGHVISVLLPALTGVMEVVNIMAEAPGEGRNLVILMDRRYQDERVLQSLPRFYDIKLLSGDNDYHGERYFG